MKAQPMHMMERTARFGESVIELLKKVPETAHTRRIIDQLTGAGTSVGANYCEADNSVSPRDFRKCVSFSRKEARETQFFLRMLACAHTDVAEECRKLTNEAEELTRILSAMFRNSLAKEQVA